MEIKTEDIYQITLEVCHKIIPAKELAENLEKITTNIKYLESEQDGWYSEQERNLNITATLLSYYAQNIKGFLRKSLTEQGNSLDETVKTIFDLTHTMNRITKRKILDVSEYERQHGELKDKVRSDTAA